MSLLSLHEYISIAKEKAEYTGADYMELDLGLIEGKSPRISSNFDGPFEYDDLFVFNESDNRIILRFEFDEKA